MTDFIFKREEKFGKTAEIPLTTELNPEELKLVQEMKALTDSRAFVDAWSNSSTDLRELKVNHPVPYAYGLTKPKAEILEKIQRIKDFIDKNMERIERQTPNCVAIVTEMRRKAEALLALNS